MLEDSEQLCRWQKRLVSSVVLWSEVIDYGEGSLRIAMMDGWYCLPERE